MSADPVMMLRVAEVMREASQVVSFHLCHPDGGELPPFEPGAHIDVHLGDDLVRQYSLCGEPAEKTRYRIAVLAVPYGKGSARLHTDIKVGDLVAVSPPRNTFRFDVAGNYIFIAGGIGITPLLPMIQAASRSGAEWVLHYCTRDEADAPFVAALRPLGDRVRIYGSRQEQRLSLAKILVEPEYDTLVYCCGPERMMTAATEAARAWAADRLRFEWFTPKPAEAATAGSFEVFCARKGVTLMVPPDMSLLNALGEAGVRVRRSCRQGMCRTCEVTVLEGIPDHRDSVLSASEHASNQVMCACVSRAKTPRLVLDL